jgi:hypothetical protein
VRLLRRVKQTDKTKNIYIIRRRVGAHEKHLSQAQKLGFCV